MQDLLLNNEHNIIHAIVLCIPKAASEANRALTNISDLSVGNHNTMGLLGKILLKIVL